MFLLVLHRSVLPLQKLKVKLKVEILYISSNTSYSKRNRKIEKWLACENASLKIEKHRAQIVPHLRTVKAEPEAACLAHQRPQGKHCLSCLP